MTVDRDIALRRYVRSFGIDEEDAMPPPPTCLEHSGVCARVEDLARRVGEAEEAVEAAASRLAAQEAQIADLRAQVRPWSNALVSALGSLLTAALAVAAAKGGLL